MLFEIEKFWDGTPCPDGRLHGTIQISREQNGLRLTAELPNQTNPNNPSAPSGTRVDGLWEYDVVECFLVGKEKYLEVELGAAGHFLVFSFKAPRERDDAYVNFSPEITYCSDCGGDRWQSSILIPWEMVPAGVHSINNYVIVGPHESRRYLCWSPLPGKEPDFHQPSRFPACSIEEF